MKYILILYVCSYATETPKCNNESITGAFDKWSACINQGYKQSHFYLNELYQEDFEDEKLAIRFSCEEQGEPT
ncbi:hypothetical protein E5R92_07230 [Candidatus Pelagibacter giovannonii]|uniref:Uncharacterized protein n=1 Tax=Candidatus Pelagibacter giovannonii TaxID=2563896 RepID=A0A6H1Q3Q6_9PROT|nr:hypothetical protein [Candidatus Pelagibacter giovannonii]QIZ21572.1 hypothetical protein E5R92_07230 [Candidatus Pelagibacter giovannonii]|tara:strand:+ start:360 stop:578 length:219 start_codon:yes stop_codon:yes gene_type:complete